MSEVSVAGAGAGAGACAVAVAIGNVRGLLATRAGSSKSSIGVSFAYLEVSLQQLFEIFSPTPVIETAEF
tara:strand:+ start:286 stop:495 length:210 start_codon:yes stop_codon:yes gene_type:complete